MGDLVDDDEIPSAEHPPEIGRARAVEPNTEYSMALFFVRSCAMRSATRRS
jgi:hypothetical protein